MASSKVTSLFNLPLLSLLTTSRSRPSTVLLQIFAVILFFDQETVHSQACEDSRSPWQRLIMGAHEPLFYIKIIVIC